MAARQNDAVMIEAKVHPGGRLEALKHALGANALHGHRRTNADKRRCVEIALREFPKLSSRAVAEMCGVSPQTVVTVRPDEVSKVDTSKRSVLRCRKTAPVAERGQTASATRPAGSRALGLGLTLETDIRCQSGERLPAAP